MTLGLGIAAAILFLTFWLYKDDLNNWWSKCNTLFYGHDYMLKETIWNGVKCGVKEAVDEFVEEHKKEIKHFRVYTGSNNPTWFIWKN